MIDGLRRVPACDRICSVRGFEAKVERKPPDALANPGSVKDGLAVYT